MFPSFFEKPTRIQFIEQEPNEQIVLLLRRHWVTNVPWIINTIIGTFLPFFVIGLLRQYALIPFTQIPQGILSAVLILWYLGVLAYAVQAFLDWYFNIYIVTNQNLVDVDFYNLTQRDIVTIRLSDIESVSSNIKGIIASLFQYGDVTAESAAETVRIVFAAVPRPDYVADKIQDLRAALPNGGTE